MLQHWWFNTDQSQGVPQNNRRAVPCLCLHQGGDHFSSHPPGEEEGCSSLLSESTYFIISSFFLGGAWLLQNYSLMTVEKNGSEPSGLAAGCWVYAPTQQPPSCSGGWAPEQHEPSLLPWEHGMPCCLQLPLALSSVKIAIQSNLEGGGSDRQPCPPKGGPLSCLSPPQVYNWYLIMALFQTYSSCPQTLGSAPSRSPF